jgi:glycerol-3-phosphate acyltransferase PlsX
VVEGALESLGGLDGHDVVLVGRQELIEEAARVLGGLPRHVEISHASQVVAMDEKPTEALRRKRDSSIARCVDMMAAGEADAMVSAGNTGAVVAHAMLKLKLLEGVKRPGIAVDMPSPTGYTLVIDAGANVKCTPEHLYQYGVMAAAYAKDVYGKKHPKVGLLNIGEEESKGTDLVQQADDLFERSSLNYIGYVEGRDVFTGAADVVVCEGFVGNVLLKVSEGVADAIFKMLKEALQRTLRRRIGARLVEYALRELAAKVDHSEHGGAPLLGVNGTCMIAHGGSNSRAIANAIRCAAEAAAYRVNEHIVAGLHP